ncbi:MAG TPA: hypothetical protein VFW11_08585, partial [Cyclobacteriaceae bacterium]|nr:hypothetical protein [Cyclobacteriaceae bacterium]
MKIDFLRNAYRLIHPLLRKKGIGIVLLLVASSVLDFFSLAFFLPLIFLLIDPTTLQTNAIFQRVYFFFGSPELTLFAAIFTFFVFVFIVLKVIVNSWIILKKAQYAYRIGRDMASLATNRFLNLPYEEFTHADLSNEVNLISNMPLVFANNIIIPMGTLLSETLLFTFLLLLVALYNIQAFALLLALLVPVFVIYQLRRKKIKHIASSFRDSYPSILKHTIQITEGLPDIRSYVKEASFKYKLEKASKRLFEILALDHTLNASIPRLIEVAAAGVVCTIIGYTLLTKHSQQESLMLLSLYAGASFRLVPSINRILASIQQIKVHEYSVKEFMRIL